jgi:hypothetical protein
MNDTRFIELVNLYVDRQISPAEQAELELEIRSNARRRQVYLQYCRMHRATKLVYDSFRAQAGDQPAAPARQPASIAHIAARARQRRARWYYAAGGLAAAACVAFVFATGYIRQAEQPALASAPAAPVAIAALQPAPAPVQPAADPVMPPAARETTDRDFTTLLASLRAEQERLAATPGQPVNFSLFDDGVFDSRNSLPLRPQPVITPRRNQQRATTEFTAFQFQR